MKYIAFSIAVVALISIGCFYTIYGIKQAPKLAVQQFNTISDKNTYTLNAKRSLHQNISMPTPWSAIAIRYIAPAKKTKDTNVTLTLEQAGNLLSTIQTTTATLQNPTSIDGTDFFAHNSWLLFNLPSLNSDTKNLSITVTIESGHLVLPYDQEKSTGLNIVGLITTNWTQRLAFSLTQNNNLQLFILLPIVPIMALLIWHSIHCNTQKAMAGSSMLLLALFAILYTLPLFTTTKLSGRGDWTEVVAHFSAARQTFAIGQFPLWNPYFCGGFPAWSNPQTYWPSLIFILSWLTNDIIGTKLAILTYLVIGMGGMYALCRSLRLSAFAAAIAALIYCGNGFIILHLGIGHLLWLSMAWIPWTIFFFIKSLKRPWYLIPSVISALVVVVEGQVYFAIYTFLFLALFSIAWYWHTGKLAILNRLMIFLILFSSVGAIKLLPTFYFIRTLPKHFGGGTYLPAQNIYTAFLQRNMADIDPEYGAYIGLIALFLFITGISRALYTKNRLYVSVAIIVFLFLFFACLPSQFNVLRALPLVADLRTQTRALVIVMLGGALLAAYGVHGLLKHIQHTAIQHVVGIAIIAWLALDYTLVAFPVLHALFSESTAGTSSNEGFKQIAGRSDTAYTIVQAGGGNSNYCPPHMRLWQPKQSVISSSSPEYKGEVYTNNNSPVTLTRFTPNRITITVGTITQDDIVHINQNYDRGWYSNEVRLSSAYTHLSFPLTPEDSSKIIYVNYTPQGFLLGAGITIASIIAIGIYAIVRYRKRVLYNTA